MDPRSRGRRPDGETQAIFLPFGETEASESLDGVTGQPVEVLPFRFVVTISSSPGSRSKTRRCYRSGTRRLAVGDVVPRHLMEVPSALGLS